MASMNPDPDSWVLDWIMPYLDEQGYFNEDMAGVLNYFYTIEGKPVFSQDPEVLKTNFPHKYKLYNPTEKRYEYVEPKSFTFLGSTLFDNEILMRSNPNYLAELNSLPDVERARLLYGNWFAREQGSNYFNRNLLVRLREAPSGVSARGWDKASTEPSDKERYPDFTSSIKMIRTQEGRFCIVGDYCPENQEDDGVYKGRFRKPPSQRDKIIIDQALYDGKECKVILPVDVGQAGKSEYQSHARQIIAKGITVRPDPMPTNKSKVTKYSPFSSALGAGLIDIVESSFPDKATLDLFLKENEAFNGERSSAHRKDDWPDCLATTFNYLNEQEQIPNIVVVDMSRTNPFKI
jgi:phage terminase large subunit-like protein